VPLTITIIPASGLSAVIADGNKSPYPDGCTTSFAPAAASVFQDTPGFRAPAPFQFDRFNLKQTWAFSVCHSFATTQLCFDFAGQRAAALPRAGEIQIITVTGQGAFTRYLRGATLRNPTCTKMGGATCWFSYNVTWTGGYSLTF